MLGLFEKKRTMGQSGPPPVKEGQEYVNCGQEDQMEIHGFCRNSIKTSSVWCLTVATVGLLRLFFYWFPQLLIIATHTRCSLSKADVVTLKDQYKQWFVAHVRVITVEEKASGITENKMTSNGKSDPSSTKQGTSSSLHKLMESEIVKYFITKKVKYIWNEDSRSFQKAKGLEDTTGCSYFHDVDGLPVQEQEKRRIWYGGNTIPVHVTPILKLIVTQVVSPFYVFQIFSVALWCVEAYYYYSGCIVLMSVLSITAYIYQTRKMERALRNTVGTSTLVTVCRGEGVYEDVSSEDLVPGDVLEIPRQGCIVQCDAVLVTGNCVVNESMLTGESVPATKTPLPNPKIADTGDTPFNIKHHSRHVLFCGTKVIQTRNFGSDRVKAVVVRTGFSTAKGELVRSILHPKPVDYRFNRDTYIYVGVLACIAVIGFIYTIILMVNYGNKASLIIIRSLDLITIAVPPALPAALTVGIVFAQHRLKKKLIYCISPRSINLSGTINVFCFDKTGTLTEDGLNMQCILTSENGKFVDEIQNIGTLPAGQTLSAMATCHSLAIIDGVISGDPIDLIMFEATGWEIEEPQEQSARSDMMYPTIVRPKFVQDDIHRNRQQYIGGEIGIIKQFTFSSNLQRMSVITQHIQRQNVQLFTKGSPEMIASLSRPETVPSNFHEILTRYTKHGYRVLGLAWRPLQEKLHYSSIQRIQREQVEKDLDFLGLLVMENRLKSESKPVINQLNQANIRTVMVTGDNILTAMSVARECEMTRKFEKFILVKALPPKDTTETASIDYTYADDNEQEPTASSKKETRISIPDNHKGRLYHFVMDGKTWAVIRKYFPDLLPKIVLRGIVFARMSPDQKTQLVESLQELGYYVGMCGDGANDCGALKTAHAGISLSEAEASVASPFTSKKPDIECVPHLIGEGRAALVTSMGVFKFMACYSLTQFISVCILYWIGNRIANTQFLYIDLLLLTTLCITFGNTECYPILSPQPPLVNMFSIGPISSLLLQTTIVSAFQIYSFINVQQQTWFTAFVKNSEDDIKSYENMAVFLVSTYQYITLSVVFSKGAPYRKKFFTNFWFVGNLIFCISITVWLTIYPTEGFAHFMELQVAPVITYRLLFIGVAVINFFICLLTETYLVDSRLLSFKLQRKIERCLRKPDYYYKILEKEMKKTSLWPPISTSASSLSGKFERIDNEQTEAADTKITVDRDIMNDWEGEGSDRTKCITQQTELTTPRWRSQPSSSGGARFEVNTAFVPVIDDINNQSTRL